MCKITGINYGIPSPEGGYHEEKVVYYARFDWTMNIKAFFARILYDEVLIETNRK